MLEESININKNQLDLFNIPIKLKQTKDKTKIFIKSIKETEAEIEIIIEYFTSESEKSNGLTISYVKEDLTPQQLIFIGWSYIIQWRSSKLLDDFFKNKAIQYLKSAVKNNTGSCLPHYLLASPPLDYIYHPNSLSQMYIAVKRCNDSFPEFYSLIYEREKDSIKALNILKEGLGKFPANLTLNYHMSNILIEKEDYKSALDYLEKAELENIKELHVWKYYTRYFYNKFICNMKLNNYIFTYDLLEKSKDIDTSSLLLLKGILLFNQENFKESVKLLWECIGNDTDNLASYCAHFYLLDCYINLKDALYIDQVLKDLPEKRISYYNGYFGFNFSEIAERSLSSILKLKISESLKAKALGLLASITIFEKINIGDEKYQKQSLNNIEIRRLIQAEKFIKRTLINHPKSSFFQTVNSNIISLMEKYQECINNYLEKHKEYETVIYEVKLEHPQNLFYYDYSSDKKQLLKKYHNKKPGHKVILYLFENQNTVITIEEIEKISGKKKIKSLHQVVRDLGFEGPIKDMFFTTSDNTLEFRAAVKNKDLK